MTKIFKRQARKRKKGFTLIEILLSITVLGIVCASVYPLFSLGTKTVGRGKEIILQKNDIVEVFESNRTAIFGVEPLKSQLTPLKNKVVSEVAINKKFTTADNITVVLISAQYAEQLAEVNVGVDTNNNPIKTTVNANGIKLKFVQEGQPSEFNIFITFDELKRYKYMN
ncbi:MAG: type II secretion system protein [Clostridia bacterium]